VWLNGLFTKVVVSCDSEQELLELYEQANSNGLPSSLIVDAGLTEFNGVPTKTCIAIGPAKSEYIDKITEHLKLL
jgi:PTH2 family peptidyl-tRNA hydrolase